MRPLRTLLPLFLAAHAPFGLRPARLYAGIAPAAVHALHMPSRVFLALGLWDETASSRDDGS